jgi:VPDSG-CTERM motif
LLKSNRMGKIKYIAVLLIAVACVGLQQAKADLVTYYLTQGNPAISGYTGSYATVTVNRTDSTHATITFISLTTGGNIYLMGDLASVAVNVNAASWTLGAIKGSNSDTGFTPGPYSDGGSANVDGFGVLNQTINSFAGFKHSSSAISLTLTNTSGTWSNAMQVLAANAQGAFAAAHIFVHNFTAAYPANAHNGALATGFAGNDGAQVPDGGATVMLLCAALGALGMARRFLGR